MPIVVFCYSLVNLSFFAVLSYEQIESAEAVGLVCVWLPSPYLPLHHIPDPIPNNNYLLLFLVVILI